MPKSITIAPVDPDGKPGKPGQVYYPLVLRDRPKPTPQTGELLIRVTAASLNHRDLFLRQHLYPGVSFDTPLLADGVGVVVSAGPGAHASWVGKRVIINPGTGWQSDPDGPEDPTGYKILGGTTASPKGTLQEFVTVDQGEVEEAPAHLSDAEAAAFPLTGLTGWRALISKAGAKNCGKGAAVLVTGIGGGVALMVLRFAVARGADVYVTSSSEEKLNRAIKLGAKGGVSYREEGWEKKLLGLLPSGKRTFDAIVDGAGGDIVGKGTRLLKVTGDANVDINTDMALTIPQAGGVISIYGMTIAPKMPFLMQAVLKNIDVRGSTMGSRQEFKEMVEFVAAHQIRPVVSRVVQGIENIPAIDGLFEDMKNGSQFGKLVIEIEGGKGSKL